MDHAEHRAFPAHLLGARASAADTWCRVPRVSGPVPVPSCSPGCMCRAAAWPPSLAPKPAGAAPLARPQQGGRPLHGSSAKASLIVCVQGRGAGSEAAAHPPPPTSQPDPASGSAQPITSQTDYPVSSSASRSSGPSSTSAAPAAAPSHPAPGSTGGMGPGAAHPSSWRFRAGCLPTASASSPAGPAGGWTPSAALVGPVHGHQREKSSPVQAGVPVPLPRHLVPP